MHAYSHYRHPKELNTSQSIATLISSSASHEHQIARVASDYPCGWRSKYICCTRTNAEYYGEFCNGVSKLPYWRMACDSRSSAIDIEREAWRVGVYFEYRYALVSGWLYYILGQGNMIFTYCFSDDRRNNWMVGNILNCFVQHPFASSRLTLRCPGLKMKFRLDHIAKKIRGDDRRWKAPGPRIKGQAQHIPICRWCLEPLSCFLFRRVPDFAPGCLMALY